MFSKSVLRLAVVALSVASVAHASWPHPGDQVQALKGLIVKRQGSGENTAQATPTSSPSQSPTDDPTDTTDKPTPSPTKPTSTPSKTSSEDDETTSSSSSEATPETITTVITTTNSEGAPTTLETAVLTTKTPGLNANNGGGSSGMSTGTRNTIIGVVVGVGGAIILGALALVAWRIWGRKKHAEESDNLMTYGGGYGGMEKSDAGSSAGASSANRNPFQQTLETYHAPTQVNPSANF